ncbi:hypothetical protein FEM33_15035 [Dyadobacter flavalbus]|uniref:Uncharacterized protein n=1 Tax=Dyadobacter flavalbus TaxID=2579942 RepID=A0A5M8QS92_9BACT|nr:hypothetical protein [Dyadobacter flavalbus]KAA6438949.1 hypothetical protein FEM33_15035 [Dyadobacter flavalbus]
MTKSKKTNTLSSERLAAILAANEKCHQLIREIGNEISTGASTIKKDLSGFSQDSQIVIVRFPFLEGRRVRLGC